MAPAVSQDWEASPRLRRRRRALGALTAVAVLAVPSALGAVLLRDGDRPDGSLEVTHGGEASVGGSAGDGEGGDPVAGSSDRVPPPAGPPSPPPDTPGPGLAAPRRETAAAEQEPVGAWRPIALAPIAGRAGAQALWTGEEVLVWGGWSSADEPQLDGAAYDPYTDRWRTIAVAPRPAPRFGAVALWTGTDMLVLGAGRPLAYRPATDRWRDLAAAPDGEWAWTSAGWTGEQVVVLADAFAGDGEPGAIGYDPAADAWEALPPPPVAASPGSVSARLGDRLVVAGLLGTVADARAAVAVYHPGEQRWSPAQPPPFEGSWTSWLVAQPEQDRVLLAGDRRLDPPGQPKPLYAWSEDSGWRELPPVASPLVRGGGAGAHWTGEALLVWNGDTPANGGLLWPGAPSPRWLPVAEAPLTGRTGHAAVWTGEEFVVWGGVNRGVAPADGAAFSPGGPASAPPPGGVGRLEGRWRHLAGPGFSRDNPSLDWTGRHLLLWGGAEGVYTREGSAYDPASGAWTALPDAPIAGRQQHVSVWTGSELLVWGGGNARAERDGAAYDPERRAWRGLPEAPLAPPHHTVGVWTGGEFLVVTGPAVPSAAAYDPATDTWRELADPPPHGHRVGAVWTGSEMVVVSDALDGTVVRYDPAADRWSRGSDHRVPIPTYGAEVAWTGEEVLVWGGAVDEPSALGFAYDPASDAWRRLRPSWAGGTLTAAGSVWTGRYWVVLGTSRDLPALAAYDPEANRWLALPPSPAGVPVTGPLAWTGEEIVAWSWQGRPVAFRPGG